MPERHYKILVVDDSETDAEILQRHLARIPELSLDVRHRLNRLDALRVLDNETIDLVFVDYHLGIETGLDVVRDIRARHHLHPVIAFTGRGDEYIATELIRAGADDYVVKGDLAADVLRRAILNAEAQQALRWANSLNSELIEELSDAKRSLEAKNQHLAELYQTAHEFVDNVAHEFRTPLTVIKEFASIMRDGIAGPVNAEQSEYLDLIEQRVEDLSTLVDDMLDTSRLEAGLLGARRNNVTVQRIIETIQPVLDRRAAAGKITLQYDLPPDLPEVYCDEEKAARVVINLAINAVKFTQEAGCIRLWAEYEPADGQVRIAVADHGPGIPPEQVKVIFERFRQGNYRGGAKGFGLGLNIAGELVRLNLGDMDVTSKVGEGSTFSFTLPIADPLRVVQRLLRRIEATCGDNAAVALALIEAPAADENSTVALDDFLQRHLHRHDLLFRKNPVTWILVTPGAQECIREVLARIDIERSAANRHPLDAPLPELESRILGAWRLASQHEEFLTRFQRTILVEEPLHAGQT